jgi:pimeloyl-ACP methyl ester carboxylesterase
MRTIFLFSRRKFVIKKVMKKNNLKIDSLEKVVINNSEQWLLVRGKNSGAPLVIHVQAGPGLPIIPEADAMEKLLHLEDNYLVAYWDQRACGKSFNKNTNPETVNFSQLSDDVIFCTKYLLQKYKKDKAIIIGYSMGATLSLIAAAKDSSIFDRLFLVGIDIDIPTANNYTLEFLMTKSKGNKKLLKQVADLGKEPITDTKRFQKRAKLLTDLGGIKTNSSYNQLLITTISNMLFSKSYRLSDIPKTIKGMEFSQNALLPEFNALNLFDKIKGIGVPVHFIQGKQDGIAPYQTAVKYYESLQAEKKSFTSFDHSAHMPHYEEPDKFARLLKETINR